MTHFFDMVVSGKTDYDQMALASLGVNKKIKNEFIQLDRNLSTPVNTGAEQYCHRNWMLTIITNGENESRYLWIKTRKKNSIQLCM